MIHLIRQTIVVVQLTNGQVAIQKLHLADILHVIVGVIIVHLKLVPKHVYFALSMLFVLFKALNSSHSGTFSSYLIPYLIFNY